MISNKLDYSCAIKQLNKATSAYDEGHPYISDKEWDDLYFEVKKFEESSGIVFGNSPTQKINFEIKSGLNKVTHNHPMLSLDKTKSIEEVQAFLGKQEYIAMAKMDGLTCSLTYKSGQLISAETRGNGEIGEDVLHNAKVISSIPLVIDYKDDLIIDGEIICTYADFKQFADEYKNPRNFASGSIRLLDNKECSQRNLTFVAWEVIKGFDNLDLLSEKLEQLNNLGFTIVPYGWGNDIETSIKIIQGNLATNYPIDGVVFKFDSKQYSRSLGQTAHHFKNAIAYKFYDETYPTHLVDIEWSMGRTGILTPIAVFEPVDIDCSIVERASLHNISIMEQILGRNPFKFQQVNIYKANMIIPQIASAEDSNDKGTVFFLDKEVFISPETCPICGGALKIVESDSGTKNLICTNENCDGKLINKLDHFCGKNGLDIKGLSKATLSKLIEWGWIETPGDIFRLKNYDIDWSNRTGFGVKSVGNLLASIEAARKPTLEAFISAIGIPFIGKNVAKELVKHVDSYEDFRKKVDNHFDFSQYEGFADSKTNAILNFDYSNADEVYQYMDITFPECKDSINKTLANNTIVITGRLEQFKNRAELVQAIEDAGGKVTNSVSKSTNYLINNDNTSTSTKNLSAQKLGIPILTEKEFIEKFLS